MPSTNPAARRTVSTDDPIHTLLIAAKQGGVPAAFRRLLETCGADRFSAQQLGAWHERLLDEIHGSRRRTGNYYTPPMLVELLLDHALEPVLAAKVSAALGRTIQGAAD